MNRKRLAVACLLSLAAVSTACEAEDASLSGLDADETEFRDLSPPYVGEEVLIQNLDNRSCLAFDVNTSTFPLERPCDAEDKTQLFRFEVQTFIGGLGFIYKICSADTPAVCLMHESSGTTEFISEEQVPNLLGTWFEQVRIQHDEDDAFIEFRNSGRCVTAGTPPTVQKCDWFGSAPQHYRLLRPCSVWVQDCDDGHKCAPYATTQVADWDMGRCVSEDAAPGQLGDPCTVDENASGEDTCDQSTVCFHVSPDTNEGVCTSLCTGSPNAPLCDDPTTACVNAHDDNLPLCLEVCDPLTQSCSSSEQVCAPAADGSARFTCVLDTADGAGVYGTPCSSDVACNPGLFCGEQNTVPGCTNPNGCCSEFCDLDASFPSGACTGIANGQTCQPWFESGNAPPGYENVGFCGISQGASP